MYHKFDSVKAQNSNAVSLLKRSAMSVAFSNHSLVFFVLRMIGWQQIWLMSCGKRMWLACHCGLGQ